MTPDHDIPYRGTYLIWGPPGTGKTTFLSRQVRKIVERSHTAFGRTSKNPVLVCSLTRTAAAEIAGRNMPIDRRMVGTLHSHAYRAIEAPPLAESKELLPRFNEAHPRFRVRSALSDTVDDMRSQPTAGDSLYELYHLARARERPRDVWNTSLLAFARAWESWKDSEGAVDFTDMIELAIAADPPGSPDVIISDECQDLSSLEFRLLRTWGDRAGCLMLAGDSDQALYTFRGAHPEIFVDPSIPDDHRIVLHQSYRVCRAAHAASKRWISTLTNYREAPYEPTEIEGEIGACGASWRTPEQAVRWARRLVEEGERVMIAASCSFMLEPTVALLKREGAPFANPWRVRRGDWNPLGGSGVTMSCRLADLLAADPMGDQQRRWTWEECHRWAGVMKSREVLRHGAKAELERRATNEPDEVVMWEDLQQLFYGDQYLFLKDWMEARARKSLGLADEAPSVTQLVEWWRAGIMKTKSRAARYPVVVYRQHGLDALRAEPLLHAGTYHSFKGGECDTIFMFPDVSPSAAREWGRASAVRDSVVRTFYVGLTRARRRVVVCNPVSAGLSVNLSRYARRTAPTARS